jgi:exo-beta-1,3-glucanase (GH17 family)
MRVYESQQDTFDNIEPPQYKGQTIEIGIEAEDDSGVCVDRERLTAVLVQHKLKWINQKSLEELYEQW